MYKFLLIFFLFIQVGCENSVDEPEPATNQQVGSTMSISETDLMWFLRSQPDSIVVYISGGKPPYIITRRPKFLANAKIIGNEIYIYPIPYDPADIKEGFDFLNIQDSNEEVMPINLMAEYQVYRFSQLDAFTLSLTGDTTLTDILLNRNNVIIWDAHEGVLRISSLNDDGNTGLGLRARGVFEPGIYDLDTLGTSLGIYNNEPSKRSFLYLKSSSEKILVEELSKSKLKGLTNATFKSDPFWNWQGEVTANATFTVRR